MYLHIVANTSLKFGLISSSRYSGFGYLLKQDKVELDYRAIWNRQALPEELKLVLEEFAVRVSEIIKAAPETVRNVGEYCKTQACWATVQSELKLSSKVRLKESIVGIEKVRERKTDDKKLKKIDNGREAQIMVTSIPSEKWLQLMKKGQKSGILTPKEAGIIRMAASKPLNLSEKQSTVLVKFLEKAEEEGIVVSQ